MTSVTVLIGGVAVSPRTASSASIELGDTELIVQVLLQLPLPLLLLRPGPHDVVLLELVEPHLLRPLLLQEPRLSLLLCSLAVQPPLLFSNCGLLGQELGLVGGHQSVVPGDVILLLELQGEVCLVLELVVEFIEFKTK